MLSQVRVSCATTPCATLFFPQLPAVAAAHGDVQRLRVQAEEGLLLMQSRAHARIAGVGGRVGAARGLGGRHLLCMPRRPRALVTYNSVMMQRRSLAIGNDQRRLSEQAAVAWDVPFACDKGSGEG